MKHMRNVPLKTLSELQADIELPNESLISLFRKAVKDNRGKPLTYFKGKFKTYGLIEEEVNRLSNSLRNLGIRKGDRISVLLPNSPQFITTFFAAQALGAIFTALNPMYSSHEIIDLLKDSKPKVLITLDLFIEKIKEIKNSIDIEHTIITSVAEELPISRKILYKTITVLKEKTLGESILYKNLLENGENSNIDAPIDPYEDIAILQYTGGTTGEPKGAMLTHLNLISQVFAISQWKKGLEKLPDTQYKVAGFLPYSHIFGLTSSFLWPIKEGATIYLVPDPRKLEETMKIIDKYKIHFLNFVPIFFQKIATHKKLSKYDFSSLYLCISGGESLPAETVEIFERKTKSLLIEGYGLTEASPVTHINPPNKSKRKIGSIGITIPNTFAKIVDIDTGEEITKINQPGELWIKGPGVMKGYWRNKEATEDGLIDGWLRTGDIAVMNDDGYFKIIDRLKDVIIVSGFKVWPNEVEKVLTMHPSILEAVVVPYQTGTNTKIKAILVKKDGFNEPCLEDIRRHCRKYLAPYKIPKIIEYRDILPRSHIGKILRRELKKAV